MESIKILAKTFTFTKQKNVWEQENRLRGILLKNCLFLKRSYFYIIMSFIKVYYSMYGHIKTLANEILAGLQKSGGKKFILI